MQGFDNYTIYYCKSYKACGKPIVISNGKEEITTNRVKFEDLNTVLEFNNSTGKVKSRGATTVLKTYGRLIKNGRWGYIISGI